MTATTQIALWIAFVILTLGALYFGTKAWAWRSKEGMEFPLKSFYIALWAATLYLSMITGQTVDIINGQEVFWERYVDLDEGVERPAYPTPQRGYTDLERGYSR